MDVADLCSFKDLQQNDAMLNWRAFVYCLLTATLLLQHLDSLGPTSLLYEHVHGPYLTFKAQGAGYPMQ